MRVRKNGRAGGGGACVRARRCCARTIPAAPCWVAVFWSEGEKGTEGPAHAVIQR